MTQNNASRDCLRGTLERGDVEGIERAWLEEISSAGQGPVPDLEVFLGAADFLIARGESDRAAVMLELLVPLCQEEKEARNRLEVLRRRLRAVPKRSDALAAFLECFRLVHAGDPLADAALHVSALENATDAAQALACLEKLLFFQPGACVLHASGWGVGTVESIDPVLRQIIVDLEKKRHHRVDLKVAPQIFESLPPDHLLALGRDGGARLRAMAENSPVELIGVVLLSFGSPQNLKAIKARLIPSVIVADAWSRWWNRTKGLLRDSGFYRVGDRAPYIVERLGRSMSFEDELLRQFEKGGWPDRLAIARKYCKDRSSGFQKLREQIVADLKAMVEKGRGAQVLDAAAGLERFDPGSCSFEGVLRDVLQAAGDPVTTILAVEAAEDRRRTLEALPQTLGENWTDVVLRLFPRGDDDLRDGVAAMLLESAARAKVIALVTDAARMPRNSPEVFCWSCQGYLAGEESPLYDPLRVYPPGELLGRILDLLDHLGMRSERDGKAAVRETLARARGLLTNRDARFFRQAVDTLERDEARGVYQRLVSSGGLSEPLRVKLIEIVMTEFPDIMRLAVRPIWEEDFIYVTEAGQARKQAEFREITEVKIPWIITEIGRAAAFGDLSENAEYTSALEERDRLTKRATEMKEQLDKVRIITAALKKDGEVHVGSKIRVLNQTTGKEHVYRILGPWDGDPEGGVLSYGSPLAITLLGKKEGEELEAQLPGGTERFKVMEVGSTFG